MPVYASTPGFTEQRRYPTALLLIVGGHAALIAAVMTAKMVIPIIDDKGPIIVENIPIPPDPPPATQPPRDTKETPQPPQSASYVPPREVPTPPVNDGPEIAATINPLPPTFYPTAGTNPVPERPTIHEIVKVGPRFATPADDIKPPYPDEKRRQDEEATLRLKVSIDERGRVVAVEPVGKVDRAFFESARRHLIGHWRYKPATEDGRPVPSSTVITLRFELEA